MKAAEQAKKAMLHKPPGEKVLTNRDFVSTSVTTLNLALSGWSNCGIPKGHICRISGKKRTGKTFICRGILAEAANNPEFDGYRLVYDDVEHGALMDTAKFFGRKLAERLEAPEYAKNGTPLYSRDVGEFYRRVGKLAESGQKFIWVEDSLDALSGVGENAMTDGKAKAHSQEMRKLLDPVNASGSILVVVSQVRVKMDAQAFESPDITAGGLALEHYPRTEFWLKVVKTLTKTVDKQKFHVGSRVMAVIKKNSTQGLERVVEYPFYPAYGIDDIGSMVEWLVKSGHWKKDKRTREDEEEQDEEERGSQVAAPEFKVKGTIAGLVRHFHKNRLHRELQVVTAKAWHALEARLKEERSPRYQ